MRVRRESGPSCCGPAPHWPAGGPGGWHAVDSTPRSEKEFGIVAASTHMPHTSVLTLVHCDWSSCLLEDCSRDLQLFGFCVFS